MSFDNSRYTFNPWNNYSGVVMQQGRVQTDADWNEWLAELSRRTRAGTLDTLGRAVYPATTPYAFLITASVSGGQNRISIGPGRMYVDGLLAENHGDPAAAVWDPALAELSNSPQPPPAAESGAIDYTQQPYLPDPPAISGNGPLLAYLDVWTRPVTYLEDPALIDPAVGIDTTGRLQTVWQVKLMEVPAGTACGSAISWPAASAGLLTTGPIVSTPSGPCCLSSETGYTGQENQFYRVEIHLPGGPSASPAPSPVGPGTATFKWSRENASVITGVTAIANATNSEGNPASQLTVMSLGRDQVLGFAPGNWIEILDDAVELAGQPGELHQIDSVDVAAKTITLASTLSATFPTTPPSHTRIRRWDMSGKVYLSDGTTVWWDLAASGDAGIPVPPAGTLLILENGITVSFDLRTPGGAFNTGDFWTFAARTADGSIEKLEKAPPRGIHHHYTPLSIVSFNPLGNSDCRTPWPPSTGESESCGCCCTVTVGDGEHSTGRFTSIQAAVDSLPPEGGEVCILPGRYFERVFIYRRQDVVIRGCGWQTVLASPTVVIEKPAPAARAAAAAAAAANTFAAVITIAESRHIKLQSFVVEASDGDVGVLIDGSGVIGQQPPPDNPNDPAANVPRDAPASRAAAIIIQRIGAVDITVEDLVITASTRPAILAARVRLLHVLRNRIGMSTAASAWPAIWVSGAEIYIARNWVGIAGTAAGREWLPAVTASGFSGAATSTGAFANPGGIQVAGNSVDVFIVENEIDNAGRNGITLGSMEVVTKSGDFTGILVGVLTTEKDPCSGGQGLPPGGPPPSAPPGSVIVAGDRLANIHILRNQIRKCGLCGIGPAAFFDLRKVLEVISIQNLTIASNTIVNAMLNDAALQNASGLFEYGAICVPDVENLSIRDNTIADYGSQPGLPLCGIYALHAEMADISRNQIIETRDWTASKLDGDGGGNGVAAISAALITPPSFGANNSLAGGAATVYEPGLPALRVEHNVVRAALTQALMAAGFGPFTIVNNHFSCGGLMRTERGRVAATVLIFNLGQAIEAAGASTSFTKLTEATNAATFQTAAALNRSTGAVLFSNNVCQYEARAMGRLLPANVAIYTLDNLIFSANQCWVDGPPRSLAVDALLGAGSLQVNGNRFQESAGFPVFASGITVGFMNITSQNISTYCLFVEGPVPAWKINVNNLSVVDPKLCAENVFGR